MKIKNFIIALVFIYTSVGFTKNKSQQKVMQLSQVERQSKVNQNQLEDFANMIDEINPNEKVNRDLIFKRVEKMGVVNGLIIPTLTEMDYLLGAGEMKQSQMLNDALSIVSPDMAQTLGDRFGLNDPISENSNFNNETNLINNPNELFQFSRSFGDQNIQIDSSNFKINHGQFGDMNDGNSRPNYNGDSFGLDGDRTGHGYGNDFGGRGTPNPQGPYDDPSGNMNNGEFGLGGDRADHGYDNDFGGRETPNPQGPYDDPSGNMNNGGLGPDNGSPFEQSGDQYEDGYPNHYGPGNPEGGPEGSPSDDPTSPIFGNSATRDELASMSSAGECTAGCEEKSPLGKAAGTVIGGIAGGITKGWPGVIPGAIKGAEIGESIACGIGCITGTNPPPKPPEHNEGPQTPHTPEGPNTPSTPSTPEGNGSDEPKTPKGNDTDGPKTPKGDGGDKPETPEGGNTDEPKTPEGDDSDEPETPEGDDTDTPDNSDSSEKLEMYQNMDENSDGVYLRADQSWNINVVPFEWAAGMTPDDYKKMIEMGINGDVEEILKYRTTDLENDNSPKEPRQTYPSKRNEILVYPEPLAADAKPYWNSRKKYAGKKKAYEDLIGITAADLVATPESQFRKKMSPLESDQIPWINMNTHSDFGGFNPMNGLTSP